ncbi:12824_t:CDS:2, partial [Gigaspora rosea]
MLPTIATLQEHLFKEEETLTQQDIQKFEETKKYLKQKMRMLDENNGLEEQLVKLSSNLASFFNSTTTIEQFSAVDTELKTYFDMPQMILYDFDDP